MLQLPSVRLSFASRLLPFELHSFHLLRPSSYPLFVGAFLFIGLLSQCLFGHQKLTLPVAVICASFLGLFLLVLHWFSAVIAEATRGFHSVAVLRGLRLGVILFIVSEVMFFFGFFGSFFHFSLNPSMLIGDQWPAMGTQILSPGGLPLINTILLLSSGVTVTLAHAFVLKNTQTREMLRCLLATTALGVGFLICQLFEYKYGVQFSGRDNAYGTLFFITTGFHGLHVTIGTLFLFSCGARPAGNSSMSASAHSSFESAAWYGHFVDVVWLFLFVVVYGGGNA